MKKKIGTIALTAMLVSGLLAGCSSGGNDASSTADSSSAASAKPEEGKVTLQVWHSLGGKNGEYFNSMVKSFNDTHPNIEVVPTYQGGYDEGATKLEAAIAGNNAPDIAMLERAYIQKFAESDVLTDLTSYMKASGLSKDDFVAGLMGHSTFNNKLVALPFNRSTPILYVNKDLLDQLGLAVPKTWDDMKKVANALVVKENGKITRYGVTMVYDNWYLQGMIQEAGGKFFTDDGKDLGFISNGVGEKVFNYLKDLQSTGALFFPPIKDSGSIVGQMFSSGQVGMLFQSTGVMGSLEDTSKFNIEATFMPKDQQYSTPTGGAYLSIIDSSKHKQAAWEFMNWVMTDPKGAQQFVIDSGYLPFTKKMAESQPIKDLWAKDPNRKIAYDQLQYALDTNKSVAWDSLTTEFNAAMQAIMYDDKDIKSSLDSFAKKAKAILNGK